MTHELNVCVASSFLCQLTSHANPETVRGDVVVAEASSSHRQLQLGIEESFRYHLTDVET